MQTNRFLVVGPSGSGKSQLARRIIQAYQGRYRYLVVLDTSEDYRPLCRAHVEITQSRAGHEYNLAGFIRRARSAAFEVTAVKPDAFLARLGAALMSLGDVLLVVDEAHQFLGPSCPLELLSVWTGGRKKNIHAIAITQSSKLSSTFGISKVIIRQTTAAIYFRTEEPNEAATIEQAHPELAGHVRQLQTPHDGGAPEYAVVDTRRGRSGLLLRQGWQWLKGGEHGTQKAHHPAPG